ncbi:MAG: hypothetical protein M3Y04_10750 [Actinomycetota bacterium]|nr:hypothetical protein [Actinomycetota bacterium]
MFQVGPGGRYQVEWRRPNPENPPADHQCAGDDRHPPEGGGGGEPYPTESGASSSSKHHESQGPLWLANSF